MRLSTAPERVYRRTSKPVGGDMKGTGKALGHWVGIEYATVAVMLGMGVLALWVLLARHSIKDLSARATLSLSGYLRTRPDPGLEGTVRAAFTEFDRELARILRERSHAAVKSRPQPPQDPAPPPGP